jgi:hypothetical protein
MNESFGIRIHLFYKARNASYQAQCNEWRHACKVILRDQCKQMRHVCVSGSQGDNAKTVLSCVDMKDVDRIMNQCTRVKMHL